MTQQEIVTPDQLEAILQAHKAAPHPKLGAALLDEKLITVKQLNVALQKQFQDRKTPLGQILVGMGVVTDEDIKRVLSKRLGIPGINFREFQVEANAIKAFPAALAHKHKAVPLYRNQSHIVVAMEDPLSRESLKDLEICVQTKMDPLLATAEDIEFMLGRYYNSVQKQQELSAAPILERATEHASMQASSKHPAPESDNALIQQVHKIIRDALEQGALEIHIESLGSSKPGKVRFRKDGAMAPYAEMPADALAALISQVKVISGFDTSEKRRSQEKRVVFEQFPPGKNEFRIITIPTTGGLEDVVIRTLTAPKVIPLKGLGFAPHVLTELKNLIVKPEGLLLVTGPTRSGRTTTVHSLLAHINTPSRKICTVEDPVEIIQEGLRQIQVDTKIGWTSAAVLRTLLIAGPDVVMVGETHDAETAQTIIEASLTGQLVLSTLRAHNAADGAIKLLDLWINPFNLADALLGVIGQRLLRRLCPACRRPRKASTEELGALARQYCVHTKRDPDEVFDKWQTEHGERPTLYTPAGCEQCNNIGYKGQLGVYELLDISPVIKKKIQSGSSSPEISQLATAEGMRTMKQDGIEKTLEGYTDLEQVQAMCP